LTKIGEFVSRDYDLIFFAKNTTFSYVLFQKLSFDEFLPIL